MESHETTHVGRRSAGVAMVALAALLLAEGCATLPPSLPPTQPRRGITPRSYKMKIAVFNFIDQTGSAGKLVETLPDMLSTELFGTQRFEVKERAELRSVDPQQTKAINERYKLELDALLVGSITRFSVEEKVMTLDVRVYNAFNGTVMFASAFDVRYVGVIDAKADRKDIVRVAEAVYAAFPVLGDVTVRVAGMSGNIVTINLGEKDGVKAGMGALVIARGDTLKDPVTREELGDAIYVGETYVIEVGQKSSKLLAVPIVKMFPGQGGAADEAAARTARDPVIKLNDSIRFK